MDFQQFLSTLGIETPGAVAPQAPTPPPPVAPPPAQPGPDDALLASIVQNNTIGGRKSPAGASVPPNVARIQNAWTSIVDKLNNTLRWDSQNASAADPEGAGGMLAARPPIAPYSPPQQATPSVPPPGIAVGPAPAPAGNQADLLAMFKEGNQQPTSSTMPPRPAGGGSGAGPSLPPFQTSVQPASPQSSGGIMEMLGGLKGNPTANAIMDIINGGMRGAAMNVNNPRGMGIGAFGAGYTGAQEHISKRDKEKAAAELASQKLKFDQTLAVRKDSRDERGAGREDEKLKLSREDQTRKNEETKVKNQVAVDKMMRELGGAFSYEGKKNIRDQTLKHMANFNKDGMRSPEELRAESKRYIEELEQYYGGQKQGATAPAAGALPKPGAVVKGYVFKGGDVNDRNNWVKQGQ